jgi:hypothetical protein
VAAQTTILIPTDFRVASLNTLRWALEQLDAPEVDVVLLHCETLDQSITELLFYSPRRLINDRRTTDFDDALSILLNHFAHKVGQVHLELFHGRSQSAFDALLQTLRIDAIYVAKLYSLYLTGRAFSSVPYIHRAAVPVIELGWIPPEVPAHTDSLEHLFL